MTLAERAEMLDREIRNAVLNALVLAEGRDA